MINSDKSLVSVVMTTYNYAKYLPAAIESVLNQTYKNLEIIIVNDGSTDNTDVVITPYLQDKRIKYIYQKNAGQAVAKNRGIKESTGDYIAFLDADDYWREDKIEKQIRLFRGESLGVVYSALSIINEEGDIINDLYPPKMYSGNILQEIWIDNFIGFSTSIIRRDCFETVGLFDENLPMAIDWDLWLRIACNYNFAYVNEPLLFYRSGHANMSRNIEKRFECSDLVMQKFLENNPNLIEKKTLKTAMVLTWNRRASYHLPQHFIIGTKYFLKSVLLNPFQILPFKIFIKSIIKIIKK